MDYAPVICNPPPPPHTHTNGEWRGQQLFIQYSLGPAERHSPALYDNKFNRIYMHYITSPAAGELKRPMSRTLAPLSPTHPRRCVCWGERGGGRRSVVTNDWCITNQAAYVRGSNKKVISSQCALDVSIIFGKPDVHPIISLREKHLKNVTSRFLRLSHANKNSPIWCNIKFEYIFIALNNTKSKRGCCRLYRKKEKSITPQYGEILIS